MDKLAKPLYKALEIFVKAVFRMKEKQHIYQAALYLRLSSQNLKENADESDSIVNQEALLRAHLKAHQDISIKSVFKDDGWSGVNFDRPGFQRMMQKIYDGEVDCVVVKDLSRLGRNHTETGKYITRVFPAFGVRFIAVNDNVDIALRMDADGVHVGQSDMEAGDVRALLGPDKILGVSAQTVEQAVLAEKRGADYLGVGAVFPTGSKDDAEEVSHETLKAICEAVNIPVVAIGGITLENTPELAGSGICGIAVISAIYGQKDIKEAAERLRKVTEETVKA